MYFWEDPNWPHFSWDDSKLLESLGIARLKQGRLLGRMGQLGFAVKGDAQVDALTEEVIKSSEIEGEVFQRDSVMSSVARHLGVPHAATTPSDRRTDGVVETLLDATQRYDEPLTQERLLRWHASLFSTVGSGLHAVTVGQWRDDAEGPMQVVSGPVGKQRVHYQAPPAARVDEEMARFLQWFNTRPAPIEALLRAGLAHLWFVTIHPFDDGNGRIARTITDQALAQSEGSGQRFYSMSSQIRKERAVYYEMLERTQKGTLDVTDWLSWFLQCLARAIDAAESTSGAVLQRADFWQRHSHEHFSERQRKVLNRYLVGFDGKLTSRKWAAIGKCSAPTAQRDINELVARGVLRRNTGGSKNTSYELGDS